MNIEPLTVMFALAGGAVLAAAHFGGLWWTLRRLPTVRQPAVLMLGSFLGRATATAAGFTLLMGDEWQRLLVGLAAFLAVRTIVVRRLRPREALEG